MKSKLVAEAELISKSATTWADLSNALFDPVDGIVSRAFPTRESREKFLKSPEYTRIKELMIAAQKQTGVTTGAKPSKSGRFLVRLPKTLHATLEQEAEMEGVSLNQLVVTKLAVQMGQITAANDTITSRIVRAYLESNESCSVDRVIADPEVNRRFIDRCRQLKILSTEFEINWQLLSARKRGLLSKIRSSREFAVHQQDEFEFSSEVAIRVIQERVEARSGRWISLDHILCDPKLADDFDNVAKAMAPGFTSFDYRWAALAVRKAQGRLRRQVAKAPPPTFEDLGITKSVKTSKIPQVPGLYVFSTEEVNVFVGHTSNLRSRIERHFDIGGDAGFPKTVFDLGTSAMRLAVRPCPSTTCESRQISEFRAVRSLLPRLNLI